MDSLDRVLADAENKELRIEDAVRRDGEFEIVNTFAQARMSGKLSAVRELFAENALLVIYEQEVFYGVDAILSFWKNRYDSSITRRVKFNYRIDMCMFYNGPALFERPEGYASMIITFKIVYGKIRQMLLAPEYLSSEYQYYGGFKEAPYTLDYFKRYLREPQEAMPLRVPCPNCGKLSEDLEWYTFKDYYHYYGGTVSICQHCKRTVEIFPTNRIENDSTEWYNHEDDEQNDKQIEIEPPYFRCYCFVFSTPLADTKYLNSLDDSEPLDDEIIDPFDDLKFYKNSWSLLDFAKLKGKDFRVVTICNPDFVKPFKFGEFTSPEGEITRVDISPDLWELSDAELISSKLELQVTENSDGEFCLIKVSSINKKENNNLCTEKKIVSEFNSLMISKISRENRPLFDEICYCYKRAYDDGIIEAGNNLAILYINYADREEEGMQLLKECAEKGCANAASNYFTTLWGNLQDYSAAIEFALSCKTPAVSLYWNIAALYLRGEEIKGNTLTVDIEKAKHYLRVMSDKIAPSDEDEPKIIEKARTLLSALDNFDSLREFAKQYVESTLPQCILNAENGRRVDSVINRELPHIRIPSHTSLWLKLADDHNGHGDISEFILRYGQDQEGLEIARAKEIISHIEVDKSKLGAWEVYLFSKARHFLPTFWHGAYNRLTLVFNREDMKQIPSQKGRSLNVMLRGESLKPKVYFEGDTAYVECCYWTQWGGLFREKCKIEFKGNEVTCFEDMGRENIYMYDCGIMF